MIHSIGPVIGVRQKQQGNPAGFSLDKHFGKQLSYSRDESFQHDVPIRPGNITIVSLMVYSLIYYSLYFLLSPVV